MKPVGALSLATLFALQAAPAFAEVNTYDGTDRKLYVRQVSADMATSSISWDKKGGRGSAFAGTVYRDVIFRGDVAITDERFLELLAGAHVGFELRKKAERRSEALRMMGLIGLAGLATGGVMTYADLTRPGLTPSNPLLFAGGLTVGTLGFLFVVGAGKAQQERTFTTEEAVDAVAAYNKMIDQKGQ